MTALRNLRIAMVAVGIIFTFGVWPLMILWSSGWAWHPTHAEYPAMIIGIYATLGAFLIWAARDPMRSSSLVWFTVWSSVVHALIMVVQALGDPEDAGHFFGDVPALLVVAVVLGATMKSAAVTAAKSSPQR